MPRFIAIAVPLALAACAPVPSDEPAPTAQAGPTDTPLYGPQDGEDRCGAAKASERWLNALPSAEVKAEIATAVGERRIRYYGEGDPITMDFSEERLNVVLGKDGRMKEFRCG